MKLEVIFLYGLVCTTVIETIILFFTIRLLYGKKSPSFPRILATGLLCSFSTLPYLWFILPGLIQGEFSVLISEIAVTAVESGIIFLMLNIRPWHCIAISIICNTSSYLSGNIALEKLINIVN